MLNRCQPNVRGTLVVLTPGAVPQVAFGPKVPPEV